MASFLQRIAAEAGIAAPCGALRSPGGTTAEEQPGAEFESPVEEAAGKNGSAAVDAPELPPVPGDAGYANESRSPPAVRDEAPGVSRLDTEKAELFVASPGEKEDLVRAEVSPRMAPATSAVPPQKAIPGEPRSAQRTARAGVEPRPESPHDLGPGVAEIYDLAPSHERHVREPWKDGAPEDASPGREPLEPEPGLVLSEASEPAGAIQPPALGSARERDRAKPASLALQVLDGHSAAEVSAGPDEAPRRPSDRSEGASAAAADVYIGRVDILVEAPAALEPQRHSRTQASVPSPPISAAYLRRL